MRILVVEDDEVLLDLLVAQLDKEHYAIDTASDGLQGWDYASTYAYDLLILDVMLPQMDGITLCQKLRQAGYTLPILLLTAQDTSLAKTTGLNAGADDYVIKPFDPAELIARIRALVRRGCSNPLPILTWGDLWLNSSTCEVSYAGEVLDLTVTEYALLEMMMQESQHVFSKEEILESLWSAEEFPVEATVRSHMRRLRNKLAKVGAPTDLIATSHGRGYYLKPLGSELEVSILEVAEPSEASKPSDTIEQGLEQTQLTEVSKIEPQVTRAQRAVPEAQQAQYLVFLNQTWQKHRSGFLSRIQEMQSILCHLQLDCCLTTQAHAEIYRIAHNLTGTLSTLGTPELEIASQIARNLEQELHPDIYPDPSQMEYLQSLITDLLQQIETVESLSLPPQFSMKQQSRMPIKPNQTSSHPSTIHIMLVDDDPIFLQTLPKQLQGYGFQVSTLDDPRQFWTVLEGMDPDVLILDMQMPQINGIELCQALRSVPNWQKLPVIFLSVLADAKTQHQAFAAGADDYVCKPITAKNLSDRIQNRLQRIQAVST